MYYYKYEIPCPGEKEDAVMGPGISAKYAKRVLAVLAVIAIVVLVVAVANK